MHQSINVMTLGGLALAVGILVDDATVEIENNHRQMDLSSKAPVSYIKDAGIILEINGNGRNRNKAKLLNLRAGDRDRTGDVQGRKSHSVTPKRPFGTPWVQSGSRDDAILGSF
jgi:hypothetical protein